MMQRLALYMVLFVCTFVAARILRPHSTDTSLVTYQEFGGKELTLVLIASSSCGACNDQKLFDAFPRIVQLLANRAADDSARLAVMGVGIDHQPEAAWDYFSKVGAFNEITLGRNWTNSAAFKYLWQEFPGPPEVPQIVVMARTLSDSDDLSLHVKSERLLLRMTGLSAILRWVDAGAPVPKT